MHIVKVGGNELDVPGFSETSLSESKTWRSPPSLCTVEAVV